MMRAEFSQESAEKIFPRELLTIFSESLKVSGASISQIEAKQTSKLRHFLRKKIPKRFTQKRSKEKKYKLDHNVLAFRAFVVLRTIRRMEEDAKLFQKNQSLFQVN